MKNIAYDSETVFHRYQPPPATVRAEFSDGSSVAVSVGTDKQIYAVVQGPEGPIRTRQAAAEIQLPKVAILPQPGPLRRLEHVLTEGYVGKKMDTDLGSRHFRNQLRLHEEHFHAFKEVSEASWPGLQIRDFRRGSRFEEEPIELMVRDGDFVAEVGAMGHGLQMWLQTMWFLARNEGADSIILDEPDVYMHPDLQRRLIRFVRRRFSQVVIATHSVEMMAEASPGEILIVNRKARGSRYANADPDVQRAIESVGGVHNLHLARLFSAQRVLLVEGKDLSLLRHLYDLIATDNDIPLDNIPSMQVGGWSGWPLVIGSGMFLKNALGQDITPYALFDSDYHLPSEIEARYEDGHKKNVQVHIWRKKCIENYFLVPKVIQRAIIDRAGPDLRAPTLGMIRETLYSKASELADEVHDQFADSFHRINRRWRVQKCNVEARRLIQSEHAAPEGLVNRVCGKTLLGAMSSWSKNRFGVSFGAPTLVAAVRHADLDTEMKRVLVAIARSRPFSASLNKGWWKEAQS